MKRRLTEVPDPSSRLSEGPQVAAVAVLFCSVMALAFRGAPARRVGSDIPLFGSVFAEIQDIGGPTAIALGNNDEILVASLGIIRVLGPYGNELRSFCIGRLPDEKSRTILSLRQLPSGELLAADTERNQILLLSADGTIARRYGSCGTPPVQLNGPLGMEISGDRFFVADSRTNEVKELSLSGGLLLRVGRFGHDDGELDHPSDVTIDPSGNIYVADTDNERISIFDARGEFLRNIGGAGPYPGLFHTPTCIRYFKGQLFVADSGNHRIQVFDLNGEYKYEWGVHALLPHEGHGKLHYPNQIAIAPSGRFAAVLESFEDRVQIFGPETEESRVQQQSQEKSMAAHFGAAIATAGPTMAVLEPSTPSILLWDVTGDEPIELTRFGRYGTKAGTFIRPEGVALDPEARRAFVVDPGQMTISVLDVTRPKEEGLRYLPELVHFVKSLDVRAIDDPTHPIWPIEPTAIRFGPKRDLWILDAANRRVVVFDEKLTFVRAIAGEESSAPAGETIPESSVESGVGSGESRDFHDVALPLLEPTDLALSPSGDLLYVVDAARAHVCALRTTSTPPTTSPASKEGSSDRSDERVRIIGRAGTGSNEFVRPFGIAVAPDGDIYVTDEAGHKVVRFDPTGAPKQTFGKRGLGRVEFFKPKGITFDAKGELLVLDWGNHRGQVLTRDGEFVRAFGSRVFVVPTLKKP